jgi:hypothetical protein
MKTLVAMLCTGCVHQWLELPDKTSDGLAIHRPSMNDARRYDLDAWGKEPLVEFERVSPMWGHEKMRVYANATVCQVVPDTDMLSHIAAVHFKSGSEELVPSPPDTRLGDTVGPYINMARTDHGDSWTVTIATAAARTEAASPEEAFRLSQQRALAMADWVRRLHPDVPSTRVKLVALGWDDRAHIAESGQVDWAAFI